MAVSGHTIGHIAYWFAEAGVLFCGDTLFALGCGRLFEGTPSQMWQSLSRLRALPADTRVYCAHEYTEANAAFALSVDPGNAALAVRAEAVRAARRAGRPTVPSTMEEERRDQPVPARRRPGAGAGGRPCRRRRPGRRVRRDPQTEGPLLMMKLRYSPTSPYVRKVSVVAIETGARGEDRAGGDRHPGADAPTSTATTRWARCRR